MKRIIFVFVSVLLLAGCTVIDFQEESVEEIITTIVEKDVDLYNNVFEGYKFYVPRGLKVINKSNNNIEILSDNDTFYMYVDIVSYHYKTKKTFEPSNSNYLSKELRFNDKLGYIDITELYNKYFVEFMYNYVKIEAYIEKEKLNEVILNMSYILSSVQYNDMVINTFVGENSFDYKEEKFDIFESKRDNSSFLEYIEKYDNYNEEKDEKKDEDMLDFESLE